MSARSILTLLLLLLALSPFLLLKCQAVRTINFDDIPNAAPIPSNYNNLQWAHWDVRSPDRSTASYVKAPSPFQYGRVFAGQTGIISRGMGVSSFSISALRYACSVPIPDDGFSPGPPKACTINIAARCVNGQTQKSTAKYVPDGAVANMGSKKLGRDISCKKVGSYAFTAKANDGSAVDILVDNVVASV